jgi:crotonobetainyl-CoA:carnitine CoA-transferase CaiB-like acyl-CoA transferase
VPSSNLIANAEEACKLVGERLASEDLAYWREALVDEPGVWAALATPKETLNDPQVIPNGYVVPNVDDNGVEYQIVAAPVQFDETPPRAARAPEHGQHTEEVLLELDLDWDDISAAKDSGAIL